MADNHGSRKRPFALIGENVDPSKIAENSKKHLSSTPIKEGTTPKRRSPKIVLDDSQNHGGHSSARNLFDASVGKEEEKLDDSFDDPIRIVEKSSDSDDSFDDPIRIVPSASQLDDSFDSPVKIVQTPKKRTPKKLEIEPKEDVISSGVEGFPSLVDKSLIVVLTVISIEKDEEMTTLLCKNSSNGKSYVFLQGQWMDTKVKVDAEIRLISAQKWNENDWIVNDENGIVVTDINTLVPCTSIVSSFWCPRKTVLNDRFNFGTEANKAMLIGCIMHELFQIAIQCEDLSKVTGEWLFSQWRSNISSSVMESLVALSFTPRGFETELKPYAEVIVTWVRKHRSNRSLILNRAVALPTGSTIKEIHDIEENIWEPVLGVKGKIDTTLLTSLGSESLLEPLELKTGNSRQSYEHAGQVLLYCLMLSIRYNQQVKPGSLLYLKDGICRPVVPKAGELKGIIQQRNRLAHYSAKVQEGEKLPEPRSDAHFCGKCEQSITCSLYHTIDKQQDDTTTTSFKDFAKQQVAHLSEVEIEYFAKWTRLIYLEWNADRDSKQAKIPDLWNLGSELRESRGGCASQMTFEVVTEQNGCNLLVFKRSLPIHEHLFEPGNMCTVSTSKLYGITLAFITSSSKNSITLRVDKQPTIMKIGLIYDLDVYNSFSTYSAVLGNVARLMCSDEISSKHRSLIVSLTPPAPPKQAFTNPIVASLLENKNLNQGQRNAVMKAIEAQDYTLIEGLPGTGKTTAIVILIRSLIAMGRSVLVCSFTNSAVDNIVSKLLETEEPTKVLRLGNSSAIRKDVKKVTLREKTEKYANDEYQLYSKTRSILKDTPVVACTCHHTSREVLFSWRKFDICIVDEASMVLEPVALCPISFATKFVLVGDAKQLAPLVQSNEARKDGMNISLFERLSVHREAVTTLCEQYRMNSCIATLAGSLFYEDRLVCATKEVANTTISLSDIRPSTELEKMILSSKLEDSCVFVDTLSQENTRNQVNHAKSGGGVDNSGEAKVVADLALLLIKAGVNPHDIGVICVYRKQIEAVCRQLDNPDVEVTTVDQFQGRDKSVIICSLVWTDSSKKRSDLLKDDRRLNVAITRAKHKLIVVGCKKSVEQFDLFKKLTSSMRVVPFQ